MSDASLSGAVPVEGASLYFEIHGDPKHPKLLFINGTMSDVRRADVLRRQFAKSFHVMLYDHRGMGRSTMDVEASRYTMERYAADAAAVLSFAGWEACHVIGYSFGGMVAQELALRFPARLAGHSLVLAATSAGGAAGASLPLHELVRGSERQFGTSFFRAMDTKFQSGFWVVVPHLAGLIFACVPSVLHADPDCRDVFWRVCLRLQLDARARHDTSERVGTLRCRTLVCGGSRDGIASPGNIEALHALIPGSEMHFFDGGHGFMMQDASAVVFITEFLQQGRSKF